MAAVVPPGDVALLHAPGHLEDTQVALTLGRELRRRGFTPRLVQNPAALRWVKGQAYLDDVALALVVRFFQAKLAGAVPRAADHARVAPAGVRGVGEQTAAIGIRRGWNRRGHPATALPGIP